MFRFRQALLVTLLGMGAAALLIFPSEVAAAARESARLAFVSVLPTLFPFLVAAELLISLRVTHSAGRLLGGMMPRLFRQPREAAPVLLLGTLSGYPVGAAAARRLYEEGGCSAEQAERLVALCNNSGPAFVVGVVGAALWNSPRVGWMLYACHIAAALLSGALLAVGSPLPPASRRREVPKAGPLFPAFVSAVKNSAMTCLFIAAFVIFCGVGISLVPTGNGTAGAPRSGVLAHRGGRPVHPVPGGKRARRQWPLADPLLLRQAAPGRHRPAADTAALSALSPGGLGHAAHHPGAHALGICPSCRHDGGVFSGQRGHRARLFHAHRSRHPQKKPGTKKKRFVNSPE